MNYIELINRFWLLNKECAFTAYETQLYFKLLDTCNQLGWKNPFNHSNRFICGEIGISERKLIDVRNRLKQCGLIDYESGRSKQRNTVYRILYSPNGNRNIIQNDHPKGENRSDNIKDKQKETKPMKVNKTAFVPPSFDEVKIFFEKEKLLTIDTALSLARQFVDFYESKDWMVGKNKMVNWRAAASRSVGWLKNNKTRNRHNTADHDNTKEYDKF